MSTDIALALRPANNADWPAIEALLLANGLPRDGARDHLHTFMVAVMGGEIVACAGAEISGDVALLRSVAVRPALQRQGIGRRLLEQLLHEAQRRDIARLYLLTATAEDYFARFGFIREPRAQAPLALSGSAEFQGACPASATLMMLILREARPMPNDLPVAVIGAGPVGLAAAAHLLARGITPLIFEAGARVGANLLDYAHVRLFSPWRYNVDDTMAAMLATSGWQAPGGEKLPLAGEAVSRALEPFVRLPSVAAALHLNTAVLAVTREGFDKVKSAAREAAPFVLRVVRDGVVSEHRARAVIDASGTWATPNPLGASGLPALGEREHRETIFYGIPDVLGLERARYAGKRTLVVGAGHSAANTLLALAELAGSAAGTQLVWAVRNLNPIRVFGGGDADALPARGQLGTALKTLRDAGQLEFFSGLHITEITRTEAGLRVTGLAANQQVVHLSGIDQIVCATGQRPALEMTSELRLSLDPAIESTLALGPLIDPNLHSCGSVRPHGHRELSHPEPGFFTVGVKSYGRAPTFLMMTGFEQVRSVVAAIAGDFAAADRVDLQLPETGVCNVTQATTVKDHAPAPCCGPVAVNAPNTNFSTPAVDASCCAGISKPVPAIPAVTPARSCCG